MKNKINWKLYWILLGICFLAYITISVLFWNCDWSSIFVQTCGIFLTVIAMIIIMLKSSEQLKITTEQEINSIKEESVNQMDNLNEQTKKQIDEFRESIRKQIESNKDDTEKFINVLKQSTDDQISALHNSTKEQINATKLESKHQIENFQKIAKEQTDSFINSSNDIVDRLEEVSEILIKMTDQNAELLKKEEENKEVLERQWISEIKKQRKDEYEKLEIQDKEMPILYFKTPILEHILFWERLWFYLYNQGSAAHDIQLIVTFFNDYHRIRSVSVSCKRLDRGSMINEKIGPPKQFNTFDKIRIEISLYDKSDRNYFGRKVFYRDDLNWQFIQLEYQDQIKSLRT